MITVRNDLEKVRMLVELARKREKEKLRQAIVLKDYIEEVFFPHSSKLRLAFEKLVS
jgi:NuA3 HAT complex component NTO1